MEKAAAIKRIESTGGKYAIVERFSEAYTGRIIVLDLMDRPNSFETRKQANRALSDRRIDYKIFGGSGRYMVMSVDDLYKAQRKGWSIYGALKRRQKAR